MSTISTRYEAAKNALYSTYSTTTLTLSNLKNSVVGNTSKLYSSAKETTISTLSSVKEILQNTSKETRLTAVAVIALGAYNHANTQALSKKIEVLSQETSFYGYRAADVLPNVVSILVLTCTANDVITDWSQ